MEMDFHASICRCCYAEGSYKDLQTKYHWMGDVEVYGEMLKECFDISLMEAADQDVSGVCEMCITQLRNASNFKRQVLQTEEKFKKRLEGAAEAKGVKLEIPDLGDEDDTDNIVDDDTATSDFEVPIKRELTADVSKPQPRKRVSASAAKTKMKRLKAVKAETSTKKCRKEEELKCHICKQRFTRPYNLKRHLRTMHDMEVALTRKRLCDGCGRIFYNRTWLERHLALGCPKQRAKICVKCNVVFDRSSDMFKHMRRIHWLENKLCRLCCVVCSSVFRSHDEHDVHLRCEHDVRLVYHELTFDCFVGTDATDGDAKNKKRKRRKNEGVSATPERLEHRVNLTSILQYSNASPFRDKTMKGFSCLYCCRYFKDINDLRYHTAQQNEKDKINLMIDYKLSYNPIKIDITDLQCTVCDMEMSDLNDLKDHLVTVHNKVIHKHIKDIILPFRLEDGTSYKCVVCSVAHISFKNLYHHMSSHYSNYCCNKCGAGYITIAALRKHGKTHEDGNFPCNFCEKTYTSLSKKKQHEKGVHTGGWLRNKCPHCPEIFVSYYDRSEHLVNVHNEAPVTYPCNACDKIYKKKFELNRHIKHHHLQQRNYKCDMCNAKFFSKRGVTDHMLRHIGGEQYTCDICGKTFSRSRTLREHVKVHEIGKKYQCETCKKTFMQKCSLKSHIRLHQDDLDIFKEFDDVKHLIDNRDITLKQIAAENKEKSGKGRVEDLISL